MVKHNLINLVIRIVLISIFTVSLFLLDNVLLNSLLYGKNIFLLATAGIAALIFSYVVDLIRKYSK